MAKLQKKDRIDLLRPENVTSVTLKGTLRYLNGVILLTGTMETSIMPLGQSFIATLNITVMLSSPLCTTIGGVENGFSE